VARQKWIAGLDHRTPYVPRTKPLPRCIRGWGIECTPGSSLDRDKFYKRKAACQAFFPILGEKMCASRNYDGGIIHG
jgi:hypothetical protein